LQSAYIGSETEREAGLEWARRFIDDFQQATTSETVRRLLSQALVAAEEDECYQALKLVRWIMRHEDAVLARPATPPLQ
jgi:flagellar protein FlbT